MGPLTAVAAVLLSLAAARGNVGRTLWTLFNLLDTLRALREVRANGRRVGVTTRRRLIRQSLVCWIVFVAAQPVSLLADALLYWFPFYKSFKMAAILIFITWRLQTSTLVYQNFVAPFLRRHEQHIDLTLLLFHSAFALMALFVVHLPWQTAKSVGSHLWSSASSAARRPPTHSTADHSPNRVTRASGGTVSSAASSDKLDALHPVTTSTPRKATSSLHVPGLDHAPHRSPRRPAPVVSHEATSSSTVATIAARYGPLSAPTAKPLTSATGSKAPALRPPHAVHRAPSASFKATAQQRGSSIPSRPTTQPPKQAVPRLRKDQRVIALPSPPTFLPGEQPPATAQSGSSMSGPVRAVDSSKRKSTATKGTRKVTQARPPSPEARTSRLVSRAKRARETSDDGPPGRAAVGSKSVARTTSHASASTLPQARTKPETTAKSVTAKQAGTRRTRSVIATQKDGEPPAAKRPRTAKQPK